MCQVSISLKFAHSLLPDPGQREKIKLNLYFHTSLWYLERFYEGLKGLKPECVIEIIKMKMKLFKHKAYHAETALE